jgi:hypothetical protein
MKIQETEVGLSSMSVFQDPDDWMMPQADSLQNKFHPKLQIGTRRQIESPGCHETSVFSPSKNRSIHPYLPFGVAVQLQPLPPYFGYFLAILLA